MGTVVSIDVRTPLPPDQLDAAIGAAVTVLHRADADFSPFRSDSWVSQLRRGACDLADCPPHVQAIYRAAETCRARTGGLFDPGWRGDGTLDPTGLVKGWAADAASWALTRAGAPVHCVNAAGDLRIRGQVAPGVPWRIGIADPLHHGRLVAVVEGSDLAVATSGTSERGAHVVDPRTGTAADDLASVTVVGPDLTLADAFATAAFAAGRQASALLADLGLAGWAWLTVDRAGAIDASAGFPGVVITPGAPSVPAAGGTAGTTAGTRTAAGPATGTAAASAAMRRRVTGVSET
ncbi:FAD:protein FMN transferase [Frankia sp. R82]|uniref:FAD:protein FMN transferase n=1 Tax=Frankia sp. R82 TaxID=2950553 RepID=UPI002043CB5F|nr:FAD:protein FMN transferase [Frankia sp. R82]